MRNTDPFFWSQAHWERGEHRRGLLLFLFALLFLPLVPWFGDYILFVLTLAYLFATLAMSWTLLARAGQISLGHAAFFGLGAYGSALLVLRAHANPVVAVAFGAALAALFAWLMGKVFFRFGGLYFALATFAINEVVKAVVSNFDSLTNGSQGLVGIPPFSPITIGPLTIDFLHTRWPNYYVAWLLMFAVVWTTRWLMRARVGLAFAAIRERELAAASLGVDLGLYKGRALLISAFFTGLCGAFYAHLIHFLNPNEVFSLSLSALPLVMSMFGGMTTISGPLIGALTLYLVDAFIFQPLFPFSHQMLYGIAIIGVLLFMPRGLSGGR
ncbi:MAG: branched-chain amino acid ABC transporter permease [Chloroflexi bacterium]|nr:branched-chain amino acid ABC transporter permease [Chloroflexota bacterium]